MWRVAVPMILVTAAVSLFLGLIVAQASLQDLQDTLQNIQTGLHVLLQPEEDHEPVGQPDVVPLKEWNVGSSDDKEDVDEGLCINLDVDIECQDWADDGECERNPSWMIPNCPTACGMCGTVGGCQNVFEKCSSWANKGECDRNSVWMFFNCPMACQKCGVVYNGR